MEILTALLLGMLATFSPCVIILIPTLIYRFTHEKKLLYPLASFMIAFFITFLLSAVFLQELLSSSIRNAIQVGLGFTFIVFGVLALAKRFNPLNFPLFKNTWLLGIIIALISAINPCSFAYLGVLISSSSNLIISMAFFAIGILIPAILIAIFGNKLIKKSGKIMHNISQVMNVLLIAIGFYLMYTLQTLTTLDMIIILVIFIALLYKIFSAYNLSFKRKEVLASFIMLIILTFVGGYFCLTNYIPQAEELFNPFVCASKALCIPCIQCLGYLVIVLVLSILTAYFFNQEKIES